LHILLERLTQIRWCCVQLTGATNYDDLGSIALIITIKNNEKLLMNIGLGLLGIGVIILFGSLFMDTTVGDSSRRVHNIGLMQMQQNFLMRSGLVIQ